MIFVFLILSYAAPNWKLAWSEEFDYTGLPDPHYWNYEVGFVRDTDQLYYTYADTRNTRVENGVLIEEVHRDFNSTAPNGRKYNYTSGSIRSQYKVHFLYGKFESLLKVPPGEGTWPALWLLGINRDTANWPICGEVDMMEYIGNTPNTLWATFHMAGPNYPKDPEYSVGGTLVTNNASSIYHNYTFTWTTDDVALYIDDKMVVQYSKPTNPDLKTWPYDLPFFLIINMAIGGGWGGKIDDSIFTSEVKFYIVYVRYYIDMNDPHHEESFRVLNESLHHA